MNIKFQRLALRKSGGVILYNIELKGSMEIHTFLKSYEITEQEYIIIYMLTIQNRH